MQRIRYSGDDERLQGIASLINTIVTKIDHDEIIIGTNPDPRTMTFDGLREDDMYISYAPSFLLSPDPVSHMGCRKRSFYADNTYKYEIEVDRQSTTGRNYFAVKIEGLTSGQQYTVNYTVQYEVAALEKSHANMFGVCFSDSQYIASIPELTYEEFGRWYDNMNYQSFLRDYTTGGESYTNTFTATASTMYMVIIANDIKSNYVADWSMFTIRNLYCSELTTGYKITSMWLYMLTSDNAFYPYAWTEISTGGGGSGAVDDVLVNGSSVVSNGIASINLSGYAQRSELGTAAEKDVPASGDASSAQVVMGNDSRLSDSRPASDVSAWAKQSTKPSYNASEVGAIPTTDKGSINGVATLDANGLIPSSQLPSYVDDVLEYASVSAFPLTGEAGKIYVALDTNRTYRWGGSEYAEISASIALGETQGTAYEGNKGKANADAITALQSGKADNTPTFTEASTRANIASGETMPTILGKIKKFFADLKAVAFSGSYNDLTDKPTIPTSSDYVAKTSSGRQDITVTGTTATPLLLQGGNADVTHIGFKAKSNGTAYYLGIKNADGRPTVYGIGDLAYLSEIPTDATTSTHGLMSVADKKKVDAISGYYGTSSTSSLTQAKVVTCPDFVLKTGATIDVYFYYGSAPGPMTLNVNGTGAKSIEGYANWAGSEFLRFVYNGTSWYMTDGESKRDIAEINDSLTGQQKTIATGCYLEASGSMCIIHFNGFAATNNSVPSSDSFFTARLPMGTYSWSSLIDEVGKRVLRVGITNEGKILLRDLNGNVVSSSSITGQITYLT